MSDDREEQIRRRAYEIWERWGKVGTPAQNWFEAEIELELEKKLAASDPGTDALDRVDEASGDPGSSGQKTKRDTPQV